MRKLDEKQRQILIDALVNDYLDSIANDSGYAEYVVRHGFSAIERRSDDDLVACCHSSGLEWAIAEAGLLSSNYFVSYLEGSGTDVRFFECQAEDLDEAVSLFDTWARKLGGGVTRLYAMPCWVYELQPGSRVIWRDPDGGKSSGTYVVCSINSGTGRVETEDTLIRLKNDAGTEVEALPKELYKPLEEVEDSVGWTAMKFLVYVADLKKWEPEDPSSEIDEPSGGAWDSHKILMNLIDEARKLLGLNEKDKVAAQTVTTPKPAIEAA